MSTKKIIIFSGTTEGRTLSTKLSGAKIAHTVCVASEYGMIVMDDNEYADVRVGRLDSDDMKKLFAKECGNEGIIVDATHPYATVVTQNIKAAAMECGLQYIRVIRDKSLMEGCIYDNMNEAAGKLAQILAETDDNVMLTTGSKDLHIVCEKLDDMQKQRLFVRILPVIESIKICQDNGIEPRHIIAMQGPFSKEMNMALLKQYDIKHLVTKESGVAGGFEEKISAAKELGVTCHIIARADEQGTHVDEAFEQIVDSIMADASIQIEEHDVAGDSKPIAKSCVGVANDVQSKVKVTLVGRGMGTTATMTKEVFEAVRQADAVFGATRLISDIECDKKYDMYRAEDIIPVLNADNNIRNAVVVFSGDSGFFSGAANMKEKLEEIAEVDIKCGISSVAYMASKLEIAYSDAYIGSIHGRNELVNINIVADNILYNKKSFVLLSGAEDVRSLAQRISELITSKAADSKSSDEAGLLEKIHIYIGINLSYEDEVINKITLSEACSFEGKGVMLAFIDNLDAPARPVINVFRDDSFIRDKVPMTKECVRHESILALNLRQGDVVYDIGGGTGSVAIEIAKMDPSLKVYTIEKKPEAIELIEKNIKRMDAVNVNLVRGEAPGMLAHLEPCDAAFIGGSCGQMAEILECIRYRKSKVRVVINAVSFETINEVNSLLKTLDVEDVRAMQLAVTDVKEIGSYHMMQANNPVMIYSFTMR